MVVFKNHSEFDRIFGSMFLYTVMSSVLDSVIKEFKKNFKSRNINVDVFKQYIKREIIVHNNKKVEGFIYIDTTLLQLQEEADASPATGGWSRFKFTYDASENYGDFPTAGDNTINGKYVSWHMIKWLEHGMTIDPDSHYCGNMAKRIRGKLIPKPWKKVGMFEKTYEWAKANYATLLNKAFKKVGCIPVGQPGGQPRLHNK